MKTIVVFLSIVLSATLLYAGNGDLIVNGNVGVGTTTPSNRLHISGTNPAINMQNTNGTGGSGSSLVFGHLQGDTSPIGRIYSYLINGGTGAHAGNLLFQTAVDGILNDRMIIMYNGKVGIGTTAPPSTLSVVGSQTYATTGNVAALYVKGTADSPMNLTLDAAGTVDNTPRIRFLNNGASKWQIVAGDTLQFQRDSTGAGNWLAGFAVTRDTDNFYLGAVSGTGGVHSIVMRNGGKPTGLVNSAGIYAGDVSGTTELFSFDEAGNVTQQTAHAQDAPEALYDLEDGLPMIVREVQYFLGYVRYTNHTRLARMAGMTDAEKASLSPAQRTCVIKENFAEHEARTGEKLTLLVWEEEQAVIKQRCDAERQKVIEQTNLLTAAIADKTRTAAASKGQSAAAIENDLVQLKAQQATLTIPEEYVIKPVPERVRAALGQ